VVEPPRIRQAARAVVMDPSRRVLLVHFDFVIPLDPTVSTDDENDTPMWSDGLWACPGGGLDGGESIEQGLRRELREELGLVVGEGDTGSPIWVKEHHFPMGRWDGLHDTYFLIEVPDTFEPCPSFSESELRREHIDAMLWWEYDDLMRAQRAYDEAAVGDGAFAVFSPRLLGHHVADLIERGRPAEPLLVGPR
jgi:8-oxo-dGTP pyrophosphatase MutT (NUDIX family)